MVSPIMTASDFAMLFLRREEFAATRTLSEGACVAESTLEVREEGTLEQRMETVASDYADDDLVMNMLEFARAKTKFPLCQPPKKAA